MGLQNCRACSGVFRAIGQGRSGLLCPPCCTKCDEAFKQITHELKAGSEMSISKIIQQLEIPKTYLWVLMREGKFNFEMENDGGLCQRCYTLLGEDEYKFCGGCKGMITEEVKKIQSQKKDSGMDASEAKQMQEKVKQDMVMNRIEKESRRKKENRYGLGR